MVKGGKRIASIVARTVCDMFEITKESLDSCVQEFPEYHHIIERNMQELLESRKPQTVAPGINGNQLINY